MKDENYWKILNFAVRLETQKGHLRWTMAELARGSGVSRTLIYYYFGRSKDAIIQTALTLIANEVFGLSPERLKLWQSGQIAESILRSREMLEHAPHLRQFYFHWRFTPSIIRDQLASAEKRYQQKLKSMLPHLSPAELETVFALFFGLVMLPSVSRGAIEAATLRLTNLDIS